MTLDIPQELFHGTAEPAHLEELPYLKPATPRHEAGKPREPLIYLTPRFRMGEIYGLKGLRDQSSKPFSIGHYLQTDGSLIDTVVYVQKPQDFPGGWVYKFQTRTLLDVSEMLNDGKPSGEYVTPHPIALANVERVKGRSLYEQMRECDLQVLYIGPGYDHVKDFCAPTETLLKEGHSRLDIMSLMLSKGVIRNLNEEMGLPALALHDGKVTLAVPPVIPSIGQRSLAKHLTA